MEMQEFIEFFKDKNIHYEISDSFAGDERYRQKRGGYIKKAKDAHIEINIIKAEPNQKWHLLTSYYDELSDCKKDAKDCYNRLLCPELLLWIAEAVGIDSEVVNKAATKAREIIDSGADGRLRNKAGKEITKEIITWQMIEDKIKNG
ncbi:MAG: hypothetical protein AB6733_09035 [Clostridiaceae bacterium]